MKFAELAVEQQIQFVKDKFVFILSEIVSTPTKLETYVPVPKEPVSIAPTLARITDSMSAQKKAEVEASNNKLVKDAEDENAKAVAAYKAQLSIHEKVKNTLAAIKPREMCMCTPKCLDIDSCLNNEMITPELEILIDHARKLAETGTY